MPKTPLPLGYTLPQIQILYLELILLAASNVSVQTSSHDQFYTTAQMGYPSQDLYPEKCSIQPSSLEHCVHSSPYYVHCVSKQFEKSLI